MVGLGWNIDIGSIKRTVNGLPDDYKGESIERYVKSKPNITLGFNLGTDLEIFGLENFKVGEDNLLSAELGAGFYINTYQGYGTKLFGNLGVNFGHNNDLSLNITSDSKKLGLDVMPKLNLKFGKNNLIGGLQISSVYNSTTGLKSLNMSPSFSIRRNSI